VRWIFRRVRPPYPYHSHSAQWEFYHVISGSGRVIVLPYVLEALTRHRDVRVREAAELSLRVSDGGLRQGQDDMEGGGVGVVGCVRGAVAFGAHPLVDTISIQA
jgi:hypothetical protein